MERDYPLEKVRNIGNKLDKLITIYNRIYNNYETYKINDIDISLKNAINTDIDAITRDQITEDEITIFINFIINNIYTINKDLISHIDTQIKNATYNSVAAAEAAKAAKAAAIYPYFLFKFNISGNNITITQTSVEVKKIAAELLADEKEVAEHLMLIDLGRHDVGRVAKPGSVVVTEKMTIENYSHVMHISSSVEGILGENHDALDALISGFPAGTVKADQKSRW